MASGFVKAELSTCRHGRPQVTCRLLYKSGFLLVFGLILWKWLNGIDSLGSNQECRIGSKHSHSRVSQCLASIRKLGNRRSSEGLRSFNPSKETNVCLISTKEPSSAIVSRSEKKYYVCRGKQSIRKPYAAFSPAPI